MGRRGNNAFKRNDGLRALRIAKDGGLEPNALDVIVAPDGAVTYRVYGKGAAGPVAVRRMPPTRASGTRRSRN